LAGADALVRVDVWECESASAAHELLIRLLADYQSPLVDRREDVELGDVMFAPPGAAAVLFARGNLVIGVTRAGRGDVSIVDLARRLDEDTMARPETAEGGDAETAVASGARSDGERRMRVDAPAPPTTTIKAFAPSGDLRVEHEQIVYRPDPGGEGVVTVYSIDADGRATRRVVRAPGTDVQ
jgi:hypothetical protein